MNYSTLFLSIFIFSLSSMCQAQISLAPIKVTDKKSEKSFSTQQLVFDRNKIEAIEAPDMNNLLYGQPAVRITQNKPGSGSGVIVKGASGGLGLLSFDGIPIFSNMAGYYFVRNYPLDVIDSVEVSRSQELTIESSRTLGGVIRMHSRRMLPDTHALKLEVGSRQWVDGAIATGFDSEIGNISIAAGGNVTLNADSEAAPENGGQEHDNHRMGHFLLNLDTKLDRGHIFSSFYYVRTNADSDGPKLVSGPHILWGDDPNGWTHHETMVGQIKADIQLKPHWQSSLQIGGTQELQDGEIGTGFLRQSVDVDSSLWLVKWQNVHPFVLDNALFDEVSFLWGGEYQEQHGQSDATGQQLTKQLVSPTLGISSVSGNWAYYVKTRHDHTSQDGDHALWSVGTSWQISQDTSLSANAGSTFRTASVSEILHPLFGNDALKAESGRGWELSLNHAFTPRNNVQVTYYRQNYRNLIVFQYDPTTGASRANNQADALVHGIEFEFSQSWTQNWRSTLLYGYMDAENRVTNLDVPSRPNHRLTLRNDIQLSNKLNLNVELAMHDGFWSDAQHTVNVGSVVKLNSALHYTLNPQWKIYLRAENLTNDDTAELTGFGYPRRAVYLGVRSQL